LLPLKPNVAIYVARLGCWSKQDCVIFHYPDHFPQMYLKTLIKVRIKNFYSSREGKKSGVWITAEAVLNLRSIREMKTHFLSTLK